jgi:LysM repeat protein
MSYEIIYDKQFIKAGDKFIPMLYWGSNNCYEYNGRRTRDWGNYSSVANGNILATSVEILSAIDKQRESLMNSVMNEGYSDESFGYYNSIAVGGAHTTKTSFRKYKGVFSNGIKRALSVEQLRENGIIINVRTSIYGESEMIAQGISPINEYPKTTSELITLIETSIETLKGTEYIIYVTYSASEHSFKRMREKVFPKVVREKQEKVIETVYKIRVNNSYFNKLTARRMFTSYSGKVFLSKSIAEKMTDKLKSKFASEFIELETIPYNKTMLV